MLDDAHLALLPPRSVKDALQALSQGDPHIAALANAGRSSPPPGAIITLTNARGETAFQMVEVPVAGVSGRLFVGPLPGRATKVTAELDALVAYGVRHVFGLLPAIDLPDLYRVPDYLDAVRARFGERFTLLDVVDYEVPPDDGAFEAAVGSAVRALVAGDKVYAHCGAGCGRAGVFASCVLVALGAEALEAVRRFRAARGCGPETAEQVAYVVRYAGRVYPPAP
jgi:protein-tyrosine phosphatase